MKMNYIINTARFLNRFGKAWLIKRAGEKHELVGGKATKITPRPRNGFRFSHTRFFEPASETTSASQNDWLIVRPLRGLVDDILLVFCAESAHEIDDKAYHQN
jgi:hypothetical protein